MLGDAIRDLRKQLQITQAELAAAIGMPGGQSYISAVERGEQLNLELDTVDRLAKALGVRRAVLMGDAPLSSYLQDPPLDQLRAEGLPDAELVRFAGLWDAFRDQRPALLETAHNLARAYTKFAQIAARLEDEHGGAPDVQSAPHGAG